MNVLICTFIQGLSARGKWAVGRVDVVQLLKIFREEFKFLVDTRKPLDFMLINVAKIVLEIL